MHISGIDSGHTLTWQSSKPDIVKASTNGRLFAKCAGTATLIATDVETGETGTCYVIVSDPMIRTLRGKIALSSFVTTGNDQYISCATQVTGGIPPYNFEVPLMLNGSVLMTAYTTNAETIDFHNITRYGRYTVSMKVRDQSGQIYETSDDNGYIDLTSSGVSAQHMTQQDPIYVDEIILSSNDLQLQNRDSVTLTYSIQPADTDYPNVTWKSSNPYVATVDAGGTVTALSPGETVIYAISTDGTNARGVCLINVLPQTILSLPLSLSSIESEAFTNLPNVDAIRIPASVTTIATDAFDPGMTLLVPAGSQWIQWADDNGYVAVEE